MHTTSLLEKPVDLNEWAYSTIRSRILTNQLLPNTQLKIEELAAELRISRTPIREALLRLKQDGLVRVASRVGFFVCGITHKDFDDLFELRMLIECYAAEHAATRLEGEQIEELTLLQDLGRIAVENKDYQGFNRLEIDFHDLIINSLDNKRIRLTMDGVGDLLFRQRLYALDSVDNVQRSVLEHASIQEAIAMHAPSKSRDAMRAHIEAVRLRLMTFVDFEEN